MLEWYLFRHGQTDWNFQKIFQGSSDIPLNSVGREQAQALALKLRALNFSRLYSSDLKRAVETAEIAFELELRPHLKLITSSALQEIHGGRWEGQKVESVIAHCGPHFITRWHSFHREDLDIGLPEAESKRQHQLRVLSYLFQQLRDYSPPADSAVERWGFSLHGGCLQRICHGLFSHWKTPLPIPNCVVYRLKLPSLPTVDECHQLLAEQSLGEYQLVKDMVASWGWSFEGQW